LSHFYFLIWCQSNSHKKESCLQGVQFKICHKLSEIFIGWLVWVFWQKNLVTYLFLYLLYTNGINRRKQNLFRIWILYSAFKHCKYNTPPPSYQARFQIHWYSPEFSPSRDATRLIRTLLPKATPLKSYKVSYLLQKGLPYTQCIYEWDYCILGKTIAKF
jgi:hypothetical protein